MKKDPLSSKKKNCGSVPEQCPCCKSTQLEVERACELQPQFNEILGDLSKLGLLLCFARNRSCSIGVAGCVPDLLTDKTSSAGCNYDMNLHLNTPAWQYAYSVHERNSNGGSFIGMEFFDKNHNGLFRIALTPDSEVQEFQNITRNYYRRPVSAEEIGTWRRMAELTPLNEANHTPISESFIQKDSWSAPLVSSERQETNDEMGFSGHLPLCRTALAEALNDNAELVLTVAGGFGRVCTTFAPKVLEDAQRGWLFAGGDGRMLRFNPCAVATYWIGKHETPKESYSYLEAVDCFGDLILRITSYNPDSHRNWQALASAF
ncbi:MAG: ChuX/HutX family heme-like substrate-binding protein [Verrucomicrobiota bacterium]